MDKNIFKEFIKKYKDNETFKKVVKPNVLTCVGAAVIGLTALATYGSGKRQIEALKEYSMDDIQKATSKYTEKAVTIIREPKKVTTKKIVKKYSDIYDMDIDWMQYHTMDSIIDAYEESKNQYL